MIRYVSVKSLESKRPPRMLYRNSTDLNMMVDDLKAGTEYEFSVKIIKGRRVQSDWSLAVRNTTLDSAAALVPRDLEVLMSDSPANNEVILTWRAPKTAADLGVAGYVIQYTTNWRAEDLEWMVEAVVGESTSARIGRLRSNTKYYFKICARTAQGYLPYSPMVAFTTAGGMITTREGLTDA